MRWPLPLAAALPPLDARRIAPDVLEVDGCVPTEGRVFEGHFPGRPVLPGFVQLHWVAEWAREHLGAGGGCTRIDLLRFREPLLPGDRFALRIEAGASLRFALRRDRHGVVVSEGRWVDDGSAKPHDPAPSPTGGEAGAPLRLPQQGPAALLSRVLSHAGGSTVCEATLRADAPLVREGRAPVWLAFELLAQGMAAQGGLALAGDASERRALVVGARRLAIRTLGFQVGETLWVRADHERGETGLVVCDCALGTGAPPESREAASERALACGRLTAFVQSANSSS